MMNNTIEIIQSMREKFGWDQTDSIPFLIDALHEEVLELKESLNEFDQAFQDELADVLMYAISIAIDKGYDIEKIIYEKAKKVEKREY
ncbi:MazG nucleotide pyrophosphohydrolase domain-containing protein [Erysipelothrix urinaevulpis]|uniref:MazG nucleotide pyrophosphohydrolase domain-containing protein n=2 Tax=Erysipelothrix urinaevulpis TaxID=2683717 RepID=UPI001359CBCF|nr:MazG nucleotide pyrophosphohydrolase domain-containing protein [Erysipelothrix urinaevulpis]